MNLSQWNIVPNSGLKLRLGAKDVYSKASAVDSLYPKSINGKKGCKKWSRAPFGPPCMTLPICTDSYFQELKLAF